MAVVCNSSPLIYLAKATHLQLLRKTYAEVYVSEDVWREAVYPILYARSIPEDVPIILDARDQGWLKVRELQSQDSLRTRQELLEQGLGAGESSSIALAKEFGTILIANDEAAIEAAKRYNVETRWVTEALHDALKADHIVSVQEYTEILDACVRKGMYVAKKDRENAILKARETRG